jgi:hypothetical protein
VSYMCPVSTGGIYVKGSCALVVRLTHGGVYGFTVVE